MNNEKEYFAIRAKLITSMCVDTAELEHDMPKRAFVIMEACAAVLIRGFGLPKNLLKSTFVKFIDETK